jgi:hypothetical protein
MLHGLRDAEIRHAGLDARVPGPRWTGAEPIEGRTLLVHAEQGIGDTLLALRWIAPLARAGAHVVLRKGKKNYHLVSFK